MKQVGYDPRIDYAYAAGFIDGEGCIYIDKRGYLRLEITNTGKKTLEYIASIIGGKIHTKSRKVNKTVHVLKLCSEEALRALRLLKGFLVEKHEQAELATMYMHEIARGASKAEQVAKYRAALTEEKKK